MKSRIMSNKNRTSFRLDIIDKGKLNSYHFNTQDEAIKLQNKIIK